MNTVVAPVRWTIQGLLMLAAGITLVPLAWLVAASLKAPGDFFASLFLPQGDGLFGVAWDRVTGLNFTRLFTELSFANAVVNSFFLASVTSLLSTFSAAMGGYALAKFRFRGRDLATALVLGVLIVPGSLLLAPSYQLLHQLGLLNTYTALLLPALGPAFGVFLFRQAMLNAVPGELLEAARLDGCGEIRIFVTIVIPLVRPMVGAFLLISFLGTWNNFLGPQVVLSDPDKFPLAVAMAQLRSAYSTDFGLISAGTVISVAPVMALFLLLQREFLAGLTSGAVKG